VGFALLSHLISRLVNEEEAIEEIKTRPSGPVFVSYRTSDGEDLAASVVESLHAHGVPAWHAEVDLLSGNISSELLKVLRSGLSGAVLVVTEESRLSGVVRHVESPLIVKLADDPSFVLIVANAAHRTNALDYDAPDELLGLERGTLSGVKQMPLSSTGDAIDIARSIAKRRMELLPRELSITIDIQTRLAPHAMSADGLVVRLSPPQRDRLG
jgi:hypothetical protein